MNIFFLLDPVERNNPTRAEKWKHIEDKLIVTSVSPIIIVEKNVLNTSDVIITHRQEYDDNIKNSLTQSRPFVVVFSGGVRGCKIDNDRKNTLWVEFPAGIDCIVSFVINLINNQGITINQAATEALARCSLNKNLQHLIAFSILCQGYLAAYGGDGLNGKMSGELKDVVMKRWADLNLENSWWDIININTLHEELKDKEEDEKAKIEDLLIKIINKNVSVDRVKTAYDAITRIIKR